ncbi:MAG TPA: 2-dehydropantoate 2-reductase [Anaerolineae bacterium]
MRITIIGAGALGCLFGALLSRRADVTLLDRSPEVVDTLRRQGLRLLEGDEERTCRVAATTLAADAGRADLALILVKSGGTAWAAAQAQQVLAPDGLALTLQNGLGNREILSGLLGSGRACQGVTAQGATLLGPGRVRHAGAGATHLETRPEIAERMQAFAGVFAEAGIETHLSPDLNGLVWGKLIVNAGINALTAILRVPNGMLAEIPAAAGIMAQVVAEAACVAEAKGIKLPYTDAQAQVLAVCRATAANRSSMLQDVLRDRPTEIEAINGAVVRIAAEQGLAAPVNSMLADLVRALDAGIAGRVHPGKGEN